MNNIQPQTFKPNYTQTEAKKLDHNDLRSSIGSDEIINDFGICFNRIVKETEATLTFNSILDAIGRKDSVVISQDAAGRQDFKKTKCKNAPSSLYIHADDQIQEIKFGDLLGHGFYKRAYKLGNGKVILLPNVLESRDFIQMYWGDTVRSEVEEANKLKNLGLLTCNPKNVSVSLEGNDMTIPAYICDDFKDLKDIFVLDNKKSGQASEVNVFLQQRNISISSTNTTELIKMTTPLIKDMATLFRNKVYPGRDSIHSALSVENQNVHFRCFCFDLSGTTGQGDGIQSKDTLQIRSYKSCMDSLIDKIIKTLDVNISQEQHTELLNAAMTQLINLCSNNSNFA